MQDKAPKFFDIDINSDGQRLDNFLIRQLKGVPKGFIYKLIRKGQIRINGKRCKPLTKLNFGDCIRVAPLIMAAEKNLHLSSALADELRQNILWETQNYLIVNKPQGLASHAGGGVDLGLIEAMQLLREDKNLALAHRLDKATSGCIMLAKDRHALLKLQDLYRERKIQKTYLALVVGKWDKNITQVNQALTAMPSEDGKFVFADKTGKSAQTKFEILQYYKEFSLIQAQPRTGRTHQIRVHCKNAGYPILGDNKYGIDAINKQIAQQGYKRLFLHAISLEFVDPFDNKKVLVQCQPDKKWQDFLAKIQ